MKKLRKSIIILLPAIFFIIWAVSLGKCEILTLNHGDEFSEIYKENTMLGKQQYWKVLNYSDIYAEVYYVGVDNSNANILYFKKEDDKWKYYGQWKTVWSNSGSASGVIWPYWWHFIYCGF